MNRKLIITVVGICLIGLTAAAIVIVLTKIPSDKKGNNSTRGVKEQQKQQTSDQGHSPTIDPKQVDELTQSAWIPYWDYQKGLDTLKANEGKFNEILPVVYELKEDGSLKKTKGDQYKSLQQYAKSEDIKFIPSIAMFDHELFSKVLQNDENRTRHVQSILNEIENNNFDGIDLDYESTKLDDKEKYFDFLSNLKRGIDVLEEDEDRQITLSITVLPKWGDATVYPSLKETRQVQDWRELSKYGDQIRIMAYDYTSQYSQNPGPIAPLDWIENVLLKAVEEIPAEKIILGMHNYSYNWAAADVDLDLNFFLNPPGTKIKADSYTYDIVQKIKQDYAGTDVFESSWGERYYKYKRNGGDRILVYIDQQGITLRKQLAAKYGIQGVSFWRLGGDSKLKY